MQRKSKYVFLIVSLVLLGSIGLVAFLLRVRVDLTADKRYSLHDSFKQVLQEVEEPLEVTLFLNGSLNSGFRKLRNAVADLVTEMQVYAPIKYIEGTKEQAKKLEITPTVIHERQSDGKTVQTTVYPYAAIGYRDRLLCVPLLHNNRTISGEENLNRSIEMLEFLFAETIHTLQLPDVRKIAFLEGHGELGEKDVYDLTVQLAQYFDGDRGVIDKDASVLNAYKTIIVAQPQSKFSERDKFIVDQYIMHGGSVLWLMDGVRFSSDMLAKDGYTPIIVQDMNLNDMFFRYGVRINNDLVQDMQCLPVPVDVSQGNAEPNFQPLPWTYAPLLLTSPSCPITRNVMQVKGTFASTLNAVGEDDGLAKTLLLCTSSASRITPAPGKVDLADFTSNPSAFKWSYLPVGVLVEGSFPSFFAHRMLPDSVENMLPLLKQSVETKQIFVACGSVARNDWQENMPLPVGYDRYTKMQLGNRDFLVNAVLYLAGDQALIALRNKVVSLRLINDKQAHLQRSTIQITSITLPLLLLLIIGFCFNFVHRKKYI